MACLSKNVKEIIERNVISY